jgi:hypothetical protein
MLIIDFTVGSIITFVVVETLVAASNGLIQ